MDSKVQERINTCIEKGGLKLNLGLCSLKTIPDEVFELQNLKLLTLHGNSINLLPDKIGLLKNLHTLELRLNQLSNLPDAIGDLQNLRILSLKYNQLVHLPDTIGQLQNLQSFELGRNQLVHLPDMIGQLQNLQSLELGRNQLVYLPDTIGQLQNLQTLNLSRNPLKKIPESIAFLPKLRSVSYETEKLDYDCLFKNHGLAEIREILLSRRIKKSQFPIPPELRQAFQKYFSGFDEFFRDIKGKEIGFTVKKIALGLEFEMAWDETQITFEEVQEAFQNYFRQLVKDEVLLRLYTEIEYDKVQLARLEMKQEAEILGFKQQIRILNLENSALIEQVNKLIKTTDEQDRKILQLETAKEYLERHNRDLNDIAKKPLLINQNNYNNVQISTAFDQLADVLEQQHIEGVEELKLEIEELKSLINQKPDAPQTKAKTKSLFRKILDGIKDYKTVTKDLEDVRNWTKEKTEWIVQQGEEIMRKIDQQSVITPDTIDQWTQLFRD